MTLIELMIVVAIVGILAAIAYPSYQEQVRTSRRADAQAALMQLAQFMERYYTENDCYQPKGDDDVCDDDNADPTLPFSEAPVDGNDKYYDLTQQINTGTAFTLRATPKRAQSGNGYLELSNTGARSWDEDNSGAIGTSEADWNRG
jgi:type IV pilus assembly protein PilE